MERGERKESRRESFTPRVDVLPPAQQRLWRELGGTPSSFVLYGGTALALRLGHRQSADFDFFSSAGVDSGRLLREAPYLRGAEVVQRGPDTLTCLVDRNGPVRVSFFGGLNLRRIANPDALGAPAIRVASLLALAATKKALSFFGDGDLATLPLDARRRTCSAWRNGWSGSSRRQRRWPNHCCF